jgi:hypothetical protein
MPRRAQIVQMAQDLCQLVGAELARSTGPVRERRESLRHVTSLRASSVRRRARLTGVAAVNVDSLSDSGQSTLAAVWRSPISALSSPRCPPPGAELVCVPFGEIPGAGSGR